MEPSLKIRLSLLNIFYTLFSIATANSSSEKHILSFNLSCFLPVLVYRAEGDHFPFSKEIEAYLTSPWVPYLVPSFYTLVVVFGLPLNIMAVLMFVFKIKLKKPAVVYMLNLASADLLLASVLPFKIVYLFLGYDWPFGPNMCRFLTSIFFCNTFSSILLMTAISVDRSLAVLYPMWSLSWRTPQRASLVCVAIWLVAIVGVISFIVTEPTEKTHQLNTTKHFDVLEDSVMTKYFRYTCFVSSILFFFIPLLISTACYVCIIRKLSSSNVATKPGKKRRAILLSAAVLCSFTVCFGPMNMLSFVQIFLPDQHFESLNLAYLLTVSFSTINCCLDPLIYYYATSKCQRQVWNLLCPGKQIQTKSDDTTNYSSGLGHLTQA